MSILSSRRIPEIRESTREPVSRWASSRSRGPSTKSSHDYAGWQGPVTREIKWIMHNIQMLHNFPQTRYIPSDECFWVNNYNITGGGCTLFYSQGRERDSRIGDPGAIPRGSRWLWDAAKFIEISFRMRLFSGSRYSGNSRINNLTKKYINQLLNDAIPLFYYYYYYYYYYDLFLY